MLIIQGKLVSDDIVKKHFVCDLAACKGECCVDGDEGAPLEEEELSILDDIYETVKPYLSEKGIKAVEEQGKYVPNEDGGFSTPLIDGKACAYILQENGITFCGIERAQREGKIKWPKPVSCHLYPIRIKKTKEFEVLNYERWKICKPACGHGEALKIPLYEFVKAPLIRKYGPEFYEALEATVNHMKEKEEKKK